MARVHPHVLAAPTSSKQEVFTLWMKSLIFSSNGCVAFDSDGEIVYRVDNYGHKCSNRVYIMDVTGRVLFTIVRKCFSVLGIWEGHKSTDATTKRDKPGFRVRKMLGIRTILGFLRGYSYYKVVINGPNNNQPCEYVMENRVFKSTCKIVDTFGGLVAEVKRKTTTCGVVLGEDVLTMVVEPHSDQSLVMGLVVVFGLINHKL